MLRQYYSIFSNDKGTYCGSNIVLGNGYSKQTAILIADALKIIMANKNGIRSVRVAIERMENGKYLVLNTSTYESEY